MVEWEMTRGMINASSLNWFERIMKNKRLLEIVRNTPDIGSNTYRFPVIPVRDMYINPCEPADIIFDRETFLLFWHKHFKELLKKTRTRISITKMIEDRFNERPKHEYQQIMFRLSLRKEEILRSPFQLSQ